MKEPNFSLPIIVGTLNRYEHFVNCIESLKQNSYACYSDLYISVDYPPEEKYVEGNKKIKEYLAKGVTGFRNTHIFYQEKNLGYEGNYNFLSEQIDEQIDYIYTEDDNIFSKNFLKYIYDCYEFYKDNPDIIAITSHSIPIDWNTLNSVVEFDTYYNAWGYVTWKNKNNETRKYILEGKLDQALKKPHNMLKVLKKDKWTYCCACNAFMDKFPVLRTNGNFRSVDIAKSLYMIVNKKKYIMPTITMSQNIGYDGSGLNCGVEDFFKVNQKQLNDEQEFCIINKYEQDLNSNYKALSMVEKVSSREVIYCTIKYIVFLVFRDKGIAKLKIIKKKIFK